MKEVKRDRVHAIALGSWTFSNFTVYAWMRKSGVCSMPFLITATYAHVLTYMCRSCSSERWWCQRKRTSFWTEQPTTSPTDTPPTRVPPSSFKAALYIGLLLRRKRKASTAAAAAAAAALVAAVTKAILVKPLLNTSTKFSVTLKVSPTYTKCICFSLSLGVSFPINQYTHLK